jgi:hypothetical protein
MPPISDGSDGDQLCDARPARSTPRSADGKSPCGKAARSTDAKVAAPQGRQSAMRTSPCQTAAEELPNNAASLLATGKGLPGGLGKSLKRRSGDDGSSEGPGHPDLLRTGMLLERPSCLLHTALPALLYIPAHRDQARQRSFARVHGERPKSAPTSRGPIPRALVRR